MSVFDEDIIENQLDNIIDKYFDYTNALESGLRFHKLLDSTLTRCRKRSKGTFVWACFDDYITKIHFVKNGIIQYSVYYKPPLYGEYDIIQGDIIKIDYTKDENKKIFEKYNFHEIENSDFYDINDEWLNKFYNIIFNHECI